MPEVVPFPHTAVAAAQASEDDAGSAPADAPEPAPAAKPIVLDAGGAPAALDLGGLRVELRGHLEGDKLHLLDVWMDASGVALLEWQVQQADGEAWQLPPCEWPKGSGVNGPALQTMLKPCEGRGGQGLSLALGPWHGLRWRLLCLGPPMRWVPEEPQEIVLGLQPPAPATLGGLVAAASAYGKSHPVDSEDSDSEGDGGCAVVKLQVVGSPEVPQRAALPKTTLACLAQVTSHLLPGRDLVIPGTGPGGAGAAFCEGVEIIGRASGLSMRLDSDAAVGLFIASAIGSQLGAPMVELRPATKES